MNLKEGKNVAYTDDKISEMVMKTIKPYIDENIRLNRIIENQKETIEELNTEINKLQKELRDFPTKFEKLGRDEPMSRKEEQRSLPNGENVATLSCPICGKLVSNWEKYCNMCGQRLK